MSTTTSRVLFVTVRRMHPSEVEDVRALYRAAHPTWSEHPARYYTTDHETLVAEHKGKVVGYAILGAAGGQAIAADSAVAPGSRGRGVAFQLHDARMKRARERGFDFLIGATWPGNTAMVRLLDSLGFLPVQMVENYYPENPAPDRDGRVYVRDLRTL